MNFNEFAYVRPDMAKFSKNFKEALKAFKDAKSFEEQNLAMEKIVDLRRDFESMSQIASIRHTVLTTDEFYEKEQDFFDENMPVYQGLISEFYKALTLSQYKKEMQVKWGKQLFIIAELTMKTYNDEVLEDLKEENKISSMYTKLLASAKIIFEGEERTLSQMVPFTQAKDREIRKKANDAKYAFFEENSEEFDEIYDKLVKVRTRIAKKLHFNSFVELAYARMLRSDYNKDDVAIFRKGVLNSIVKMAGNLVERQKSRLQLTDLKYYDLNFYFKSGNPVPKGSHDFLVSNAKDMYNHISKETGEFFNYMVETNLLDLNSKKGKASGGYCTFIANYKAPFIFANFNGTSHDVNVLTHEAGHAFQVYQSRNYEMPEYNFPTYESCEIHSMSMEFFAWPYMDKFFEEEADKYRFFHLSDSLMFIPYGVAVDEFQHVVYENPMLTPKERKEAWRNIEKKYLPYKKYEGNDYLENGGYWQQQRHIYESPFYYIDYTLAQICAFQFLLKSMDNREAAWEDYLKLCKEGGTKSFLELLKVAKLESPFEEGCIKKITSKIEEILNSIDDTKF